MPRLKLLNKFSVEATRIKLDERTVQDMLGNEEKGATAVAKLRMLVAGESSIHGSKKLKNKGEIQKGDPYMSANEPFLAKFAKAPSTGARESNSRNSTTEKGTIITEVAKETTDDS